MKPEAMEEAVAEAVMTDKEIDKEIDKYYKKFKERLRVERARTRTRTETRTSARIQREVKEAIQRRLLAKKEGAEAVDPLWSEYGTQKQAYDYEVAARIARTDQNKSEEDDVETQLAKTWNLREMTVDLQEHEGLNYDPFIVEDDGPDRPTVAVQIGGG